MKDVQCYELFGGIAPKNHAFSFFHSANVFISYTAAVMRLCLARTTNIHSTAKTSKSTIS